MAKGLIQQLIEQTQELRGITMLSPREAVQKLIGGECVSCGKTAHTKYRFAEDVDEEGRPEPGPFEWCHTECFDELAADQM